MNQDQYDVFPTGISQIEFGQLHLQLTDQLLTAMLGAEGLAEMMTLLGLPAEIVLTTDDGKFDAATFIHATTIKLNLLQRCAHLAMVSSLTNPKATKRGGSTGLASPAMMDNIRRWLSGHSFTLPDVKTRHPKVALGEASSQPVAGASDTFTSLDGIDLSKFEEKYRA